MPHIEPETVSPGAGRHSKQVDIIVETPQSAGVEHVMVSGYCSTYPYRRAMQIEGVGDTMRLVRSPGQKHN
jgi:hypothetical protein